MNTKATRLVMLTGLAFVVLSYARCRKVIEKFESGEVDCRACNIRQITVVSSDELGKDTDVYVFRYSAAGNPLTVKHDRVGTGYPNVVFKYDVQGRLSEMVRPYAVPNPMYETWTKYYYDSRGRIVRDTQWVFGNYIDSVPIRQSNSYWTHHFAYDVHGRVISRVDSAFFGGSPYGSESTFQYDARGNLVRPGVVYDSRASYLRTNGVWMFVCNDYSVNNGFQATAYNAYGLPLRFGASDQLPWIMGVSGAFEVRYLCR